MMLLDYFGVFCWISGKMDEISKIWANFEVLCRGVGIPHSSVGPRHGVAERRLGQASGMPRHSKATLRRRPTPQHSSATPRRSYYSQHGNFCVLFCFVFHCSKDLSIGIMRTL